jgi:excisionase family DNA binding protein
MLTLSEAATRLRVSPSTVRREIADGRLAAVRVRRRILVSPAAIEQYLAACPSAATATAGRSESLQEAVAALSRHFHPAPPAPTRSRSRLRCVDGRSTTLQVVARKS